MFPVRIETATGVVFDEVFGFATVQANAHGTKSTVGQLHCRAGSDLFDEAEEEDANLHLEGANVFIMVYHQGAPRWCRLLGIHVTMTEGPEQLGGDTIAFYFSGGNPFAAEAQIPGAPA